MGGIYSFVKATPGKTCCKIQFFRVEHPQDQLNSNKMFYIYIAQQARLDTMESRSRKESGNPLNNLKRKWKKTKVAKQGHGYCW